MDGPLRSCRVVSWDVNATRNSSPNSGLEFGTECDQESFGLFEQSMESQILVVCGFIHLLLLQSHLQQYGRCETLNLICPTGCDTFGF